MRIIFLALLSFSLLALSATAQRKNDSPAKEVDRQSDRSHVQVVEGCLSKTANTYVITGGDQPRQYRITGGDVSALKGKIGHTVRVTGTLGESDGVENVVPPYNEGSTIGVTYSTIIMTSSRDISANCSYPGFGK